MREQQEPEPIISGTDGNSNWQDALACPDTPLLDEQCSIYGADVCAGGSSVERELKEVEREDLMSRITGLLEREDGADDSKVSEGERDSLMSRITGLLEREDSEFVRWCIVGSKMEEVRSEEKVVEKSGQCTSHSHRGQKKEDKLKKLQKAEKMVSWIGERIPNLTEEVKVEELCDEAARRYGEGGNRMYLRVIIMALMVGRELGREATGARESKMMQTEDGEMECKSGQTSLTMMQIERMMERRDYGVIRKKAVVSKLVDEDEKMIREGISMGEVSEGQERVKATVAREARLQELVEAEMDEAGCLREKEDGVVLDLD